MLLLVMLKPVAKKHGFGFKHDKGQLPQKMLRHLDPAQTLEYAKYIETKELTDKIKLGY